MRPVNLRSKEKPNMKLAKYLASVACAALVAPITGLAQQPTLHNNEVKHVLLISVDGLHALDLTNWISENPDSNIGELSKHGIRYTNASTSLPSDSFPGLAALVTGGSPQTTGFWYDVTYNRALAPPAKTTPYGIVGSPSACKEGQQGTQVGFDEEIDNDLTKLNAGGGINPNYLPRDPNNNCAPVYPHNYMRVNTIFEVVRESGRNTAWIDKHPSYEWTNGPSGLGVTDFWGPEINSIPVAIPSVPGCTPLPDQTNATPSNAWTDSIQNIKCYDQYKVNGILNQIDGYTHDHKTYSEVPALFGMNFQAVSVGEKLKGAGYTDVLGTPSEGLLGELQFVDEQVGRMVHELQNQGLERNTLVIIAAKHGQSSIDVQKKVAIANGPNTILGAIEAFDISDDGSLIWLTSSELTPQAVATLSTPENQAALGVQEIFALKSLQQKWDSASDDPRTPDIILKTNTGVIFTGGSKIAEHGGLNEDDYHVGLLVSIPSLDQRVVKTPVTNQQVAPTIIRSLGLNPYALQAVQKEDTQVLPFLF
jgi:hypothetical protein